MLRFVQLATIIISALSLFACSHTVKAPTQDDEDDSSLFSSSSETSTDIKSSSSSSSHPDTVDVLISTDPITKTSFQFTGEKKDCDFSVEDSVWNFTDSDSISTSFSSITFNDSSMKIKMEMEALSDSSQSCEEAVAVWMFTMAILEGKDIDAECIDDKFFATGTVVDSTRTIHDKKDVYKEICN